MRAIKGLAKSGSQRLGRTMGREMEKGQCRVQVDKRNNL